MRSTLLWTRMVRSVVHGEIIGFASGVTSFFLLLLLLMVHGEFVGLVAIVVVVDL